MIDRNGLDYVNYIFKWHKHSSKVSIFDGKVFNYDTGKTEHLKLLAVPTYS
jgi:hypothetical protein